MKTLGIRDKKIQLLSQLNINEPKDFLTHYPLRYEINEIVAIQYWKEKQRVCFEGMIQTRVIQRFLPGKKSMQSCKVKVLNDEIEIVLFNQRWFANYKIGSVFTFFGIVQSKNRVLITSYNQVPLEYQLGIKPIYSKKQGLTNNDFIKYIEKALNVTTIEEWIPISFRQKYKLINKSEAMSNIHFPKSSELLSQSIRYLKYEEFLKFQLCIQSLNFNQEVHHKRPKSIKKIDSFFRILPFELTDDQKKAIHDIQLDFSKDYCMYRLLQGDVGSGKTVVAFAAMLMLECQAALLAPTEILARQHYENFKKYNENVVLLTSSLSTKEKSEIHNKIAKGEVQYIIGTHAIIQEKIEFKNLGFAVIDEQQRFGVNQRKALLNKGSEVDVLIMSATPIPRTMALTIYNERDISIIKTLPKEKKSIYSYLILSNKIKTILKEIEEKIFENEQVYVVCSAIEKNEDYQVRNVQEVYDSFIKVSKNRYAVGILHGKMRQDEKDLVMKQFINKEIQVLITTTVIEVGVDVKDANVMVVYDAHRFGLSQLHQLRGRCGRGNRNGYCYFLTDSKDELVLEKLKILVESNNGFEIAEHDLKVRGPGDILGVRQSGIPNFILGDIIEDKNYMLTAKKDALEILKNIEEYSYIKEKIIGNLDYYLD